MPWVNLITAVPLSKDAKLEAQRVVTDVIKETLGREAKQIYVSFAVTDGFFWGGEAVADVGIFDVRWIGQHGLDKKQAITRAFVERLAAPLGLNPDRMRAIFTEKSSEDWGRNRGDYT
jgi:phenylpyruvate tautomerase PptA (4-oxalocrotonate tautomerase family)